MLDAWFLAQAVGRWMQSRLASVGLSADEMALCSVLRAVGGSSPTGLAEMVGSPLSTMTSMIARLQREGVLEAVPDPSDRRAKLVRLTASGERRLTEAQAAFVPAYRTLTASLALPVDHIGSALHELEVAVRADLGMAQRPESPAATPDDPAPLSAAQLAEVRGYIAWIRHRDAPVRPEDEPGTEQQRHDGRATGSGER